MFRLGCVILALVAAAYGASLNNKIVGGTDAAAGAFPYQVSLRTTRGSHFCGGSILNKNWILTAAHCIDSTNAASVIVVTGTNTLNAGGDSYRAKTLVIHPSWNPWLIRNDIALIELASDIRFNRNVSVIPLPTSDFTKVNYPAVLSGWGTTSFPGTAPNALQQITLNIISQSACLATNFRVSDTNICTQAAAGQGACHGDSGGPLVADGQQVGVVSWGTPCALGRPDVFARVFSFLGWINSYIN